MKQNLQKKASKMKIKLLQTRKKMVTQKEKG